MRVQTDVMKYKLGLAMNLISRGAPSPNRPGVVHLDGVEETWRFLH
jgi:hypothetical protein